MHKIVYFLLWISASSALRPQMTRRNLLKGTASSAFVALSTPAVALGPTPTAMASEDIGVFSRAYERVGRWLVGHPAPQVLVNNPIKRWITTKSAGAYDQAEVAAELRQIIGEPGKADVVIFSATYCPFSRAAKQALIDKDVEFTAYEINKIPEGGALVAELGVLTGRTSIPHIFIGGVDIGGCNDGGPGLRPLIASGGLEAALENCTPEFKARRLQAIEKRGRA